MTHPFPYWLQSDFPSWQLELS